MIPTKYTEELANQICDKIGTSSDGLNKICKELGISPSSVYLWLNDHKSFSEKYARARDIQADFLADEIIEIADKELMTIVKTESCDGEGKFCNTTEQDNHNRTRQMIDARKWKASKLAPKKYGDKLDVTTDGEKIQSYNVGFKKPDEG